MCHPKFRWVEPEERQELPPTNMQQYVACNQQQWLYYNELFAEVHHGIYGAYYHFILGELYEGPYWSDVKAQLGQVQENCNPGSNIGDEREPIPEEVSSSSDSAPGNEQE